MTSRKLIEHRQQNGLRPLLLLCIPLTLPRALLTHTHACVGGGPHHFVYYVVGGGKKKEREEGQKEKGGKK